jgi:3-dehydroquinate synthase
MKTLYVNLEERRYPVMVGQGLISNAGALLARQGFDASPIVVTNKTVLDLHGEALMKSIENQFGSPRIIILGDGERFKTNVTLLKIYNGMFRVHADRRSWILAFGGGVIGDIAGFAAATYMRGIPYVMAPTTLLAQVDSSIGGKVGINVPQGKNLIGAFSQPSAVLCDTGVLRTLPQRELAAGLYEIVKCGAIRSKSLLNYLDRRMPEILQCRAPEMNHIVVAAARIKADVVALDERENGLRMILNYGHTIGHAFEAAAHFRRFKHGEAVAWGMIAAVEYGKELGLLCGKESAALTRLIHRIGPLPPLTGITVENAWNALIRDKKFRSGEVRMVFLRRLGEAEIRADVDAASLRTFLKKFLAGSRGLV